MVHEAPPPDRFGRADAAALILAVGCWLVTGGVEQNLGIAITAIVSVALIVWTCMGFGAQSSTLLRLFAWGYLARTLVCLVGFYQGQGASTAFWTGSNSDSERFFVESRQSLEYAMTTFEDPGFPFANWALARVGEFFGSVHYLVNVQLVVISGAVFGPLIFLFASELVGERYARVAGWLGALHPTDVAYASGLMRDAVAAATGWAFVVFGMRAASGRPKAWMAILSVACFALTWSLRSLSALILAGVLCIWGVASYVQRATTAQQRTRRFGTVGVLALGAIGGVVAIAVVDRSVGERLAVALFRADILRTVQDASPEALNQNGLTARLNGAAGMLSAIPLLPFWLVAPFPFFAWAPPPWLGGPIRVVDALIGIGGLVNQCIFLAYLGGVSLMYRRRQFSFLALVVGLVSAATMVNIVTLGQIRYTMLHTYPLFFSAVAVGWMDRSRLMAHLGTSAAIYFGVLVTIYFSYGLLKAGTSAGMVALAAGPVLAGLAAVYLLQQHSLRRPIPSTAHGAD